MAELPKFHEFMRPLLEVLVENGEMHRHDAVAATIEKVGLTEEQKSICHETNGKFIAQERVAVSYTHLTLPTNDQV